MNNKQVLFLILIFFTVVALFSNEERDYSVSKINLNSKGGVKSIVYLQNEISVSLPFTAGLNLEGFRLKKVSVDDSERCKLVTSIFTNKRRVIKSIQTFTLDRNKILWTAELVADGEKPFSVPMDTFWQLKNRDLLWWTSWSSPTGKEKSDRVKTNVALLNGNRLSASNYNQGQRWEDPLLAQQLSPRKLAYGSSLLSSNSTRFPFDRNLWYAPAHQKNYFSIPLFLIIDNNLKIGISVAASPNDIGVDASMELKSNKSFHFRRYHNRLTPGKTLKFSTTITLHDPSWRSALNHYQKEFPEYFNPVNSNVHQFSGTSAYSALTQPFDREKLDSMAFKTNWDATFPFPYMGLFLPPVADDESWIGWRGQELSYQHLNDYYKRIKKNGFYSLTYFNVTEFGQNIIHPAKTLTNPVPDRMWEDPNWMIRNKFESAVIYDPNDTGDYIYSWDKSIVIDPGEPVYQNYLISQLQRLVDKVPEMSGITIDRLDWSRHYNMRGDDGLSFFDGKPCRSLHNSWKEISSRLGDILHKSDKVLFINNHVKRIDHMASVDGVFDEFGDYGNSINPNVLLCINKPILGWCHDRSLIGSDLDGYMQRYLYLGMFPMAPFPENDHALLPDPEIEKLYSDYGELLKAIKGKKWILDKELLTVIGSDVKWNQFETPQGIVIPITFYKEKLIEVQLNQDFTYSKIEIIHPGSSEWTKVHPDDGLLLLPVVRGCVLLRIFLK